MTTHEWITLIGLALPFFYWFGKEDMGGEDMEALIAWLFMTASVSAIVAITLRATGVVETG